MAGYQLEGPKAARMYEVILPKKLGYFGKVQEVLEDLFDEDAHPEKRSRSSGGRSPTVAEGTRRSTRTAGSRHSARRRAGYSIYRRMDGRYVSCTRAGRSTSGCW